MPKKIQAYIKLQIPAGTATPSPPVGPALGQKGVNIMEFCKRFNEKTSNIEKGLPTPVVITVYIDKSFTFITKTPPASVLLKKEIGIDKGAKNPGKETVGSITKSQLEKIALAKSLDMSGTEIAASIRSIQGTARSMGLVVKAEEKQ